MSRRRRRGLTQPRIPGTSRIFRGGCIHPDTEAHILALADEHGVSPSWVTNFFLEIGMYGRASAERVTDFKKAKKKRT